MQVQENTFAFSINKEVSILPCDLIIHRVKTASNTFVNYFDIGLYPNAIRVYVRNEVIDFLLNLSRIKRLNTNLFVCRLLTNSQIKTKVKGENEETLVVHAGDNIIQAIILRSDKKLDEELQELPDDFLIDYYDMQCSDFNYYYICLFQYKASLDIAFKNCVLKLHDKGYDVRKEGAEENTEDTKDTKTKEADKKLQKTQKVNKAGIPILD